MDGLIIKKKWLDLIFDENKVWEVRGCDTKKRGKIALIESGSGLIHGTTYLIHTATWCEAHRNDCYKYHKLDNEGLSFIERYKEPHIWELRNSKRFKNPVPYKHPQGAVIWVKNVYDDETLKTNLK